MDTKGLPKYDPSKHGDDDFVLVEMFADTGDLFRRADPVKAICPDAREWVRRMVDVGASPASPQWAINARSGTPPEKGTEGAADYSDTKVPKAWPFEPADEPSGFGPGDVATQAGEG